MTETTPSTTLTFSTVAGRVQQRLTLRKTLQVLLKTWPWAAGVLVLIAVLNLTGLLYVSVGLTGALLLVWVVGSFAWALSQKAGPYESFAYWDQAGGRAGAFANAWWFEQQPDQNAGQQLHLRRQLEQLPQTLPKLGREIALPDARWLAVVPVLYLAMLFLPSGSGLLRPDPVLTTEGKDLATKEGQKLAEKKLDADQIKGITEEEKKEIQKLQQKLSETAESLQQSGAKTAREVLAELEKRARDAERLASKLGAGDSAWASEQMVAEMRKHADTAELGDAVASKHAETTGTRAQELADKLKDDKLTNETRDRFSDTMKEIGKQAQPEDKERTVGQHVIKAENNLSQTLPKEAGGEFQALADKMKTLAQREKAREQLEKLAQQLRDSGSNITGQNQQGMQQLAGSPGQQGQGGQSGQGQQGQMQALQNAPQMQPMQLPSMSNAPQGQGQQGQGQGQNMQMGAPVPGQGNPQQMAIAPPGTSPSNGQPGGKPMLIAPIPGTQPGQPGAAMLLGSMPGNGLGGLQAGAGTAPMGNAPTAKTNAGQSGVVNAQRNADGMSSVRSVEGQAHAEQAARTSQATALESIAAEENALDDASLPTARREQVRRYFTELRKRFEKAD